MNIASNKKAGTKHVVLYLYHNTKRSSSKHLNVRFKGKRIRKEQTSVLCVKMNIRMVRMEKYVYMCDIVIQSYTCENSLHV